MQDPTKELLKLELADLTIEHEGEKKLNKYKPRICQNCGSTDNIYICETHANEWCKACISGTYKEGNSVKFLVKCKPYPTPCNFIPFGRASANIDEN